MRTLPKLLGSIDVPDRFSASLLGGWGGCVAKLAMASQHFETAIVQLPGGPPAAKGILAHRVIERWFKGKGSDDPAVLFTDAYHGFREELAADPSRAVFAELAEVFGPAEWSGFRAWVLRRCVAAGRRFGGPLPEQVSKRAERERVTGVEVPLASRSMRLKGRADLIHLVAPETYEIRDFKSGSVLDDDGNVKESIALQLQAYGLMFLEAKPGAELMLVVDIGKGIPVGFDEAARSRARDQIKALLTPVPAAGRRSMTKMAKMGADCLGCRVRHLCSGYITRAPSWWLDYPDNSERISYDSWGTITGVSEGVGGVDVTLKDAAGRNVRIDRLDRRHGIAASHVGRVLWLFDLESSGPARDFKGRRYHPHVFHELPRDRRERRAWGVQVFLGPEGTEAPAGAVTPRV